MNNLKSKRKDSNHFWKPIAGKMITYMCRRYVSDLKSSSPLLWETGEIPLASHCQGAYFMEVWILASEPREHINFQVRSLVWLSASYLISSAKNNGNNPSLQRLPGGQI